MLLLEFRKDKNFLDVVRRRIKRAVRQGILVNVFIGEERIAVMCTELALPTALLYSIYVEAKAKGLNPRMYYMIEINPDELLPHDVKKVGEEWSRRKLRKEEIEKYRSKLLVSELLEKLPIARITGVKSEDTDH